MRMKNGGALLWLGLAACGGLPQEEGLPPGQEMEQPAQEVSAQACPVGVAARVKIVQSSGSSLAGLGPLSELTDVQGTLYFTSQSSVGVTLWRSNGTDVGTVPVKTFQGLSGVVSGLTAVGNKLFFRGYDAVSGLELWVSDGTASGTKLVKDLTTGMDGSTLLNAAEVNGQLLFYRLTSALKTELWRSDGTPTGTVKLGDFDGLTGLLNSLTMKVGNGLLFVQSLASGTNLLRSDGTPGGTVPVLKLDSGLAQLKQVLQPTGTGTGTNAQSVFTLVDGLLNEVWKTDGTPAGTVRLDSFGAPVQLLGTLGSNVLLSSVDPLTQQLRLQKLSLTDGTRQLVGVLPNPSSTVVPVVQKAVTEGSQVLFSVAYNGLSTVPDNVILWATDGTAAGTKQIFQPLVKSSDPLSSPLLGTGTGKVLFVDGSSLDPMFTQGTAALTGKLASLPASTVSKVGNFVRSGSRVFFSALDDTGSPQLWSVSASFSCPAGLTEQAR
ncbi:hypothetical protein LZ198_37005 [Myxococcus sp. K15C18031901]|uniref:hypothetical protein n=1 Tax=Myxococcus dinghuensis TaxID=2906761 RepID=UPI0020A71F41|nr:hypothetical protein [Myxococcus dinghuensis]MCP3104477.1 hypothetical protein [Myxococcus dinghuensis]